MANKFNLNKMGHIYNWKKAIKILLINFKQYYTWNNSTIVHTISLNRKKNVQCLLQIQF